MKVRLTRWIEMIRTSYWFVPSVMMLSAVGLALLMGTLDRRYGAMAEGFVWTYVGGPEGARAVLSTIAGSMITVAGVAFSITIVALSLASSQFGPRMLRNFLRDTGNQVVLGTFVSAFLYCLLVLRNVRGEGDRFDAFVPSLSVTTGVVLAVAGLGVLIYFIHHVSQMIQAPHAIAAVAGDLDRTVARLFPVQLGHGEPERPEAELTPRFESEAVPVESAESGYLQAIDDDLLMEVAVRRDLLLHAEHRPGQFVISGADLLRVWPPERLDDDAREELRDAFLIGQQRTPTQDVEFAIHQMVEIALRALSPGINDPFTAVTCVDQLGAALQRLAAQSFPESFRYDSKGTLRVVAAPVTFKGVADAAFNQIRQHGADDLAVMLRLLETIAVVAAHVRTESRRIVLRDHAILIERAARRHVTEDRDHEDLIHRLEVVMLALEKRKEVRRS